MQTTISSFSECVAVTKDVVLILAALVAAYVGIKGLSTWQRQLRGNTEYALAKDVLTALYELRQAIAAVRNPIMEHSKRAGLTC